MYDYLIIGSGLFGSIFAYEAKKLGKKICVIEKRNHIGGNCYSEKYDDFYIHKYGPHIFHTSKKYIWDYVTSLVEFNDYRHKVKANIDNKIYSLPINLLTINQIWPDIDTPQKALAKIEKEKIYIDNPKNLEEQIISQVGYDLYYKFIHGYTKKQWGKDPVDLPASIIKRLPIRYNFNDKWYHDNDIYEGVPLNGYNSIFDVLLKDVEVFLNIDFFKDRSYWESKANKIVFSGQIEQYFDYIFGDLEYRSLDFETIYSEGDFQGCTQMNYPSLTEKFTRIIQHKHFTNSKSNYDVYSYEYSKQYEKNSSDTPYYPINTDINNSTYAKYKEYADKNCSNLIIGGRLGNYRYYDMDMTVGNALAAIKKEFS